MMRKIFIALCASLIATIACAEEKIIVEVQNGSVAEYSLSEISSISFDLESITTAEFTARNGEVSIVPMNSGTLITHSNGNLNINTDGIEYSFVSSDIEWIRFKEGSLNENRYPFGELAVDEVIIDGLSNPWSIDFINEDEMLFTELSGTLNWVKISTGERQNITGLPTIFQFGQGGLMDVTLHPDFEQNSRVYLAYTTGGGGRYTTAIGYGILNGTMLENFTEIFRADEPTNAGQHFGSRIVFDKDNKLFFSIGDRGDMENGQDSTNHYASVLRINDDGTVPNANPYLNAPGAKPELYTMGNRNIQGMFYLEEKEELWAIEHGPRGGDELNLIRPGENYAWPLATYGINYNGTPITDSTSLFGYADPVTYWVPSIAPCGMDMVSYNSDTGELDIIIATLAGQHLHRIIVKDYEVTQTVRSLSGYGRFRDVQMSPDGYLYASVQSPGRIVRLKMK